MSARGGSRHGRTGRRLHWPKLGAGHGCDKQFASDMHGVELSLKSLTYGPSYVWQESWAIAKMTARCALCMGALKIFGSLWLRPWLLFPKFLMGFCSDWAYKCACKIEFRSFTRSWDNRGYPKNWAVPEHAHARFSLKFLMDFCSDGPSDWLRMYWPN